MVLESIEFPTPVIQLAIEPKTKADQEKLGTAIGKLIQEDPTLQASTPTPTPGRRFCPGMGELHLEIIVGSHACANSGVGANVGKPQVAYRETIRRKASHAEGRFMSAKPAAAASTVT